MNHLPRWTVNHVGLFVTDIEVMKEFYTEVMGFQITGRGPVADTELMFLGHDPSDHHQIVLIPGRPEGSYNVVNHIALKVESMADLRRYHHHLVEKDVDGIDTVDHGTVWSVYFHDPEGNRLEFYIDTPYYVPQPKRGPLDFSQDDAAIDRATRERFGDDPRFCTIEAWRQRAFGSEAAE